MMNAEVITLTLEKSESLIVASGDVFSSLCYLEIIELRFAW